MRVVASAFNDDTPHVVITRHESLRRTAIKIVRIKGGKIVSTSGDCIATGGEIADLELVRTGVFVTCFCVVAEASDDNCILTNMNMITTRIAAIFNPPVLFTEDTSSPFSFDLFNWF